MKKKLNNKQSNNLKKKPNDRNNSNHNVGFQANKIISNKSKISFQANNRRKKIILYSLGIWWAIFSVIGATQEYFSTLKFYFLIIAIIAPIIIFLAHKYLYKALIKNKKWAKLTILVYGLVHFIPFLLQLLWVRQPGFDTIITLAIGLVLLEILE